MFYILTNDMAAHASNVTCEGLKEALWKVALLKEALSKEALPKHLDTRKRHHGSQIHGQSSL
jgi:hypothetical protein